MGEHVVILWEHSRVQISQSKGTISVKIKLPIENLTSSYYMYGVPTEQVAIAGQIHHQYSGLSRLPSLQVCFQPCIGWNVAVYFFFPVRGIGTSTCAAMLEVLSGACLLGLPCISPLCCHRALIPVHSWGTNKGKSFRMDQLSFQLHHTVASRISCEVFLWHALVWTPFTHLCHTIQP